MATINTRVILSGQGVTTDTLSVDLTTIMTVESPTVQSGALNVPDVVGPAIVIPGFPGTAEQTNTQVLYLKNTDVSDTQSFNVLATHDTVGDTSIFCTLEPGEWMCLPVSSLTEIALLGTANATTCEYGFWALTP